MNFSAAPNQQAPAAAGPPVRVRSNFAETFLWESVDVDTCK